MLAESNGSPYAGDAPKLRTACENCRQSKVKCNLSGKSVCTRCLRHGLQCQYGFANRSGKPKGSKNRATLRKLGQLQEEKPAMRGFRSSRLVAPVADMEPLGSAYGNHIADPEIDDEVRLISNQPGFWESPRSFGNTTTLESSVCPGQLSTVEGSPFTDLVDPCPAIPTGIGYPHTPVTPTFLSGESLAEGIASPSLAGSVASPYPLSPCECLDMQLFHMNRLNHLLAGSLPLRLDHSLQTIKCTFCTCQMFLQCSKCAKDSTNLLLTISVLNLTLQLFEYWVSRETPRIPRPEQGIDIRYGYYEICHEENRQIRNFLLRGLLLQCREVLLALKIAATATDLQIPTLNEDEPSEPKASEEHIAHWVPSDHFGLLPDLDAQLSSGTPRSEGLLPIIAGYEATVSAFLQSTSWGECVCGSRRVMRDESL
ncbi:hypothetical protein PENARI_c008G00283 [Penicillium arizonense]|uniref:Zn(2)-C6 fungal-type domain-containing protein n=1 Tax=Penicillium arizonense TaxID=1835702 RepID=A0A1F5LJ75_PENAI|nr:hypothetical protein PENARI_c008G00283 [Penicillium arizonense]OGE53175.1 hypothetical protein PENARI_c008G00283 [Penicillium arizonense]